MPCLCPVQSGVWSRKSFSGDATGLGEPEPGSDAAALTKMRGHWLLPAVGKPAAAAVLADLKVQRVADGKQRGILWSSAGSRSTVSCLLALRRAVLMAVDALQLSGALPPAHRH